MGFYFTAVWLYALFHECSDWTEKYFSSPIFLLTEPIMPTNWMNHYFECYFLWIGQMGLQNDLNQFVLVLRSQWIIWSGFSFRKKTVSRTFSRYSSTNNRNKHCCLFIWHSRSWIFSYLSQSSLLCPSVLFSCEPMSLSILFLFVICFKMCLETNFSLMIWSKKSYIQ